MKPEHIRRLTDGHKAEVFGFQRSYNELVFPIVSGTYFRASDLTLHLDLSSKSAGAKTNYSVSTKDYECEITVLFVPTLEIARAMEKYRNSILEYNPRSYLDFAGQTVNESIRETLLKPDSNEFALMNNGLTVLSDETNLNERIGQHNKAQLRLLNPQIINGGQTAYTLGRIYQKDPGGAPLNFAGKEVLVKVITLTAKDPEVTDDRERRRLIDEISVATNRQTAVTNADRFANESVHIKVQKRLFDKFGIFYERKRGEYSDGILSSYINKNDVLERNLFIRIVLATRGQLSDANKKRIFVKHKLSEGDLASDKTLEAFHRGYQIFQQLVVAEKRSVSGTANYRDVLAKIFLAQSLLPEEELDMIAASVELEWTGLLLFVAERQSRHFTTVLDRATGQMREAFSPERWSKSVDFESEVKSYIRYRIQHPDLQLF